MHARPSKLKHELHVLLMLVRPLHSRDLLQHSLLDPTGSVHLSERSGGQLLSCRSRRCQPCSRCPRATGMSAARCASGLRRRWAAAAGQMHSMSTNSRAVFDLHAVVNRLNAVSYPLMSLHVCVRVPSSPEPL